MSRVAFLAAICALAMLGGRGREAQSAGLGLDLRAYWPNTSQAATHYLDGRNGEAWSVLWFEQRDRWTFRQYNSNPGGADARCHWDTLSWWDDGLLRYVDTVDACRGNSTTYAPPIIYAPRTLGWATWTRSGVSGVTHRVGGVVRCTGETRWTATVNRTSNGAIIRTEQVTTWKTGDVVGGCSVGWTTNWAETYTLAPIAVEGGGTARAFARSQGGNRDVNEGRWDVVFSRWAKLP